MNMNPQRIPWLATLAALAAATFGAQPTASAEIDPSSKNFLPYTLTSAQSSSTASILTTSATGYSSTDNGRPYDLAAESEYWLIPADLLSTIQSASTQFAHITFTPGTAASWPASGPVDSFSNDPAVAETTGPVGSLTWTYLETFPTTAFCAGNVAVGFKGLVLSGGTWSGGLVWYSLGAAAPTGPIIPSSEATTLSYGTCGAAPAGESWWAADSAVTSVSLP
jgi:hypothetical protein